MILVGHLFALPGVDVTASHPEGSVLGSSSGSCKVLIDELVGTPQDLSAASLAAVGVSWGQHSEPKN